MAGIPQEELFLWEGENYRKQTSFPLWAIHRENVSILLLKKKKGVKTVYIKMSRL